MASTQEFRRRIKSVNSTSQITKAMEMVASVKMQKAQKAILAARSYVQNSWNLLTTLVNISSPENHPLLAQPEKTERTCVILITSDKGLCGSFNADVARKTTAYLQEESSKIDFIAIGKKAADLAKKNQKGELEAEFSDFDNEVSYDDTTPISKIAIDEFLSGKYQKVLIIYSHFESSLRQIPQVRQLLPISEDSTKNNEVWETTSSRINDFSAIKEYKFEPSANEILDRLVPLFVRLQIYGAILESNASEHSARMVAMKSATDNAKELIDDLTLTYNAVRQNSITSEIAEICAGAEAMR